MHTSGSWSESLSILISLVEQLRKLDAGSTLHFDLQDPASTSPSPCTPLRNYFRTLSFHHEAAPGTTLNFSLVLLETDPIRHRSPLNPPSLPVLIPFFMRS